MVWVLHLAAKIEWIFFKMSGRSCQLFSWAWTAMGASWALCSFHYNGAQIISFSLATVRNHLWICKRCYVAYGPCGEAGADPVLLKAIEGRNDAEHSPGVGLQPFLEKFGLGSYWTLDLLPYGIYILDSTTIHRSTFLLFKTWFGPS